MIRILAGAVIATALVVSSVQAQQKTVRVIGTIVGVDGPTIVVKPRGKGDEQRVVLTDKVGVFGVIPATIADIKPGAFIGVGAMPQADGSQKALRVMIFADVQRGTGEGHRPWTRPGSTMTNATVDTTVAAVEGQVLRVTYKGGEQRILIGPDATINAYVVGDRSELKPGANIGINAAEVKPDGSLVGLAGQCRPRRRDPGLSWIALLPRRRCDSLSPLGERVGVRGLSRSTLSRAPHPDCSAIHLSPQAGRG